MMNMANNTQGTTVLLPLDDGSVEIIEQAILINTLATADYRIRECLSWLDWAAKRKRVDLFSRLNPVVDQLHKYREQVRLAMVSCIAYSWLTFMKTLPLVGFSQKLLYSHFRQHQQQYNKDP